MKNLVMALSLAVASNVAFAQPDADTKGGPQRGERGKRIVHMQEELGLTDEQVEKMREIREAGGSRKEMRAVLTPEQQSKAAELKKAHGGGGEKRLNRMKAHLGLSDEQVAEIQKIRAEGGSREDIQKVLTPEQQARMDQARGHRKGQQKPAVEPASAI